MCEKAKCENALAVSFIAAIDPDDVGKVSIHLQIEVFPYSVGHLTPRFLAETYSHNSIHLHFNSLTPWCGSHLILLNH